MARAPRLSLPHLLLLRSLQLSCSPALLRCFMLLNYTLVALPEASIEGEVPVRTPPKPAFNLEPTTRVLLAFACRLYYYYFNSAA